MVSNNPQEQSMNMSNASPLAADVNVSPISDLALDSQVTGVDAIEFQDSADSNDLEESTDISLLNLLQAQNVEQRELQRSICIEERRQFKDLDRYTN